MRVNDLAHYGLANPNVAGDAPVLRVGDRAGKVLLAMFVAADAEARPLDGGETEAVFVVVTRRTQTTAQIPGRGIADETSRLPGRGGESIVAKRHPCRAVAVQRALKSADEVLAGQRLLILGLVAPATLAVVNRMGEVGMAAGGVALSATDAHGRMTTFGVVGADRLRVALAAVFDVGDRSRHGELRPRRPSDQKAAGDREDRCDSEKASGQMHHRT